MLQWQQSLCTCDPEVGWVCEYCTAFRAVNNYCSKVQHKIFIQSLEERKKQDDKWGADRNLPNSLWYPILGEEFGEVGTEVISCFAENLEQLKFDPAKLEAELIQVLAVTMAWLEDLERRK